EGPDDGPDEVGAATFSNTTPRNGVSRGEPWGNGGSRRGGAGAQPSPPGQVDAVSSVCASSQVATVGSSAHVGAFEDEAVQVGTVGSSAQADAVEWSVHAGTADRSAHAGMAEPSAHPEVVEPSAQAGIAEPSAHEEVAEPSAQVGAVSPSSGPKKPPDGLV